MSNYEIMNWSLLLYVFIILFAVIIRLIFAWIITERAYMIAFFKGYRKDEIKLDKLCIFLLLIFGVIICYLISLFFVHALPDKGGFPDKD